MKYADLHVHTFYSDSTFSPEEAVVCAKDKGLSAIAICDHDSINGIEPATRAGDKFGVEIIPGIEISAETSEAEIHLLGYFIDWKLEWFRKRLIEMQDARIERIYKMIKKLRDSGIEVSAEDVFKLSGQGSAGRLHLAHVILKSGQVKNYKDIFNKYIGFLKPCYVSNIKLSPQDAIEMLLKAGGVPVVAHAALMGKDDYIEQLIGYGLRGIEVYHTDHKPNATKRYEELASRYGLVMTGGSDCHGMGKGRVLMGGVRVPYVLVEKLREESENIRREYR